MPGYHLTVRNVSAMGSSASSLYTLFYGEPAADIMYDILTTANEAFYDNPYEQAMDDDEVDSLSPEDQEIVRKVFDHRHGETSIANDDDFRWQNVDKKFSSYRERIKAELDSGKYPAGSLKHTMLEYMDYYLESCLMRNAVLEPSTRPGLEFTNNYPGAMAMNKFASFVLIPTRTEEEIAGMKPEDSNHGFDPKEEQKRAKYKIEEIDASFKKAGFPEVYRTGMAMMRTFNEVYSLLGNETPDTKEKVGVLKARLKNDVTALKNELLKSVNKDLGSKDILAMFGDSEKDALDAMGKESHRGFGGDISNIEQYEKYLDSALPIQGYSEYCGYVFSANNIMTLAKNLDECFEDKGGNVAAFKKAAEELKEKLDNIPTEAEGPETAESWKAEIQSAMKSCTEALETVRKTALTDKVLPEGTEKKYVDALKNDQARYRGILADDNASQLNSYYEMKDKYMDSVLNIGDKAMADIRNEKTYLLESLVDDTKNLSGELRKLQSANRRRYGEEINNAIDETLSVFDKGGAARPEELRGAMEKLSLAVNAANAANPALSSLSEWAGNNLSYMENKLSALEGRGLFKDEALETQISVMENRGKVGLNKHISALGPKMSAESPVKTELREALLALHDARSEYLAVNREENPELWQEKAGLLMGQAAVVSGLASSYGGTAEGRGELSENIRKDAESIRVALRIKFAADEKYREIEENTIEVQPVNVSELEAQLEKDIREREIAENPLLSGNADEAELDDERNANAEEPQDGAYDDAPPEEEENERDILKQGDRDNREFLYGGAGRELSEFDDVPEIDRNAVMDFEAIRAEHPDDPDIINEAGDQQNDSFRFSDEPKEEADLKENAPEEEVKLTNEEAALKDDIVQNYRDGVRKLAGKASAMNIAMSKMVPVFGQHEDSREYKDMREALTDVINVSDGEHTPDEVKEKIGILKNAAVAYEHGHSGLFKGNIGYGSKRLKASRDLIAMCDRHTKTLDDLSKGLKGNVKPGDQYVQDRIHKNQSKRSSKKIGMEGLKKNSVNGQGRTSKTDFHELRKSMAEKKADGMQLKAGPEPDAINNGH